MRSGLEGVVSTVPLPAGEPGVTGESTDAQGRVWHWRFHASKPVHRVQGAWMQDTSDDVRGIHGTWLNAPTSTWWDDSNASQALDRFDEMQGPLQGLRFVKQPLKLELHVDFARQHPLFVCEHELGVAFAHSLWRVVELMRTMGWPVKPDAKASTLLVSHGAILGTRTLVLGVSKLMPGHTFQWTPQGASQQPRVDLTSNRHVVQDMSEAIELVDRAFMASVQSMVATNKAHGCAQVNLLSGGLDSRLVLLATQQHAREVQSLCFARRGSLDQTLAAEVARAQGTRHHFHSLGSGAYMTSLSTVEDYDGAVNHLASAHHRSALEAAHALDMGVLASGQTANVLFTEKAPQRMQDAFPLGRVPRALQPLAYGGDGRGPRLKPGRPCGQVVEPEFSFDQFRCVQHQAVGRALVAVCFGRCGSGGVGDSPVSVGRPQVLFDLVGPKTPKSARPRVGAIPGPTCAGSDLQPRCLASHVGGEDPKEAAMAFGAIDVACGPLACPHPGSQSLV